MTPFFGDKPSLPIENTGEQHLACALLVDTSGSMSGYERKLEEALAAVKKAIEDDDIARGRVEVCLITFNSDVKEESPFGHISKMSIPSISCYGMTSTHAAIELALKRVNDRKEAYKKEGVTYNQPWIWLFTDGGSNDPDNGSFEELMKEQREKKCVFFGIAIGDRVDKAELGGMHKDGMILNVDKDNLAAAFEFFSKSASITSASTPGEMTSLPVSNDIGVEFIKIES
jgi:uncharacterized protein YegL